jgi:hypothetical protein
MCYFDVSLPLCSSAAVGLYLGDAGFELRLGYGQHLLRFLVASLIPSKHIPGSISMRTQLLPSESFSVHHFDLYIEWDRLAASTDESQSESSFLFSAVYQPNST